MNRFFFSKNPRSGSTTGMVSNTEYQYEILSEPIPLQINHRQLHTDYSQKPHTLK